MIFLCTDPSFRHAKPAPLMIRCIPPSYEYPGMNSLSHPTAKAVYSGMLCSIPPISAFYPPRIFVCPLSIPMRKPGTGAVSPSLFAKHSCMPALVFGQPSANYFKGISKVFSRAPAHSPDGLQRSLNPFAHSRETVSGFALTAKSAYRHRTQKRHPSVSLQSCTFL